MQPQGSEPHAVFLITRIQKHSTNKVWVSFSLISPARLTILKLMILQIFLLQSLIHHQAFAACSNPSSPGWYTKNPNSGMYYALKKDDYPSNGDLSCPSGTSRAYIKTAEDFDDWKKMRGKLNFLFSYYSD